MWKRLISLSEDKKQVIAQLPGAESIDKNFDQAGLKEALFELSASTFFLNETEVTRFINCAKRARAKHSLESPLQRERMLRLRLNLAIEIC